MNIYPKNDFNIKDVRKSLKLLSISGVAAQIMDTFSAGTFLIAYALELNASYFEIGILSSLVYIGNLFQIPMAYFIEKYHNRKLLITIAHIIARIALLLTPCLIFFHTKSWVVEALIILYGLRYIFGRAGAIAWNSIVKDIIPQKIMGTFFATRMKYRITAGALASLIGAYFIDTWQKNYPQNAIYSYSFIILLAGIFAVINTLVFLKVPEPPMKNVNEKEGMSFLSKMKCPFKDKSFVKVMTFLCSWNFAINLAIPFFTAFMLKQLGLDILTVSLLTILSQFINIIVVNIWGKIADKYCYKSVLMVTAPLIIFSIFLWILIDFSYFNLITIPLLILIYTIIGVANAGVNLSVFNIALKNTPSHLSSTYLSVNSIITSIFASISSLIGGKAIDFMTLNSFHNFNIFNHNFKLLSSEAWDILFLISVIFGIISLKMLYNINESKETSKNIIIKEFLTLLKVNLSIINSIPMPKYKLRSFSPFEYQEIEFLDPVSNKKHKKIKRKLKKFIKNKK